MSADDDDLVEVSDSRIFGIGLGTFIIIVMFLFIGFTWFITRPVLKAPLKWGARMISVLIFGITLLLLVFAERKERYVGQGKLVEVGIIGCPPLSHLTWFDNDETLLCRYMTPRMLPGLEYLSSW
jgi:hypothetical protein